MITPEEFILLPEDEQEMIMSDMETYNHQEFINMLSLESLIRMEYRSNEEEASENL